MFKEQVVCDAVARRDKVEPLIGKPLSHDLVPSSLFLVRGECTKCFRRWQSKWVTLPLFSEDITCA